MTNDFIEMEEEIIQRALAKGRKEAREEGLKETAKKLLMNGVDEEVIARCTGLTLSSVKQLKSSL